MLSRGAARGAEKCTKYSSKTAYQQRRRKSRAALKKGLKMDFTFFGVIFYTSLSCLACFVVRRSMRVGNLANDCNNTYSMMHFLLLLFQIFIIAVVIVATFVIPISHLNQLHSGWIYATLVGNCLFIILQMVCLIDSTGSICKNLDKIASRSRWWAFVEVHSKV